MPIKLVFSDIDSTLAHSSFLARALRISGEDRWLSRKSVDLLGQISGKVPVFLITGRRFSGFEKVHKKLPFTKGVIEHGCIIIDEKNNFDQQFMKLFRKYVGSPGKKQGLLWDYEQMLNASGISTDSEGRFASFRIRTKGFSPSRLPNSLKLVINQGMVDIIPPMGGKEFAVDYIMRKLNVKWGEIAALGDDFNDEFMLKKAGFAITHSGAVKQVRDLVKKKGYVSPYKGHKGTVDMLSVLLKKLG